MPNRREALIGIGVTALGAATPSAFALVELLRPVLPGSPGLASGVIAAADNTAVDQRLSREIAGISSRANSEEGIPVFLVCINQVQDKRSRRVSGSKLTALNTSVAADFRQTTAAWKRIRPDAPVSDVATLIEVLAERDLGVNGSE